MTRRIVLALAAAGFILAAVVFPRSETGQQPPAPAITIAQQPLPARLSDSTFLHLIERISEPGGYFDTDNLISNESSYLHVIGRIRDLAIQGGAYLGVGPDQNFSYIAAVQPRLAFILDIRRDNLLQHIWFKSLFELSPTRIEFLCRMFGRLPPPQPDEWRNRSITDLIEYIDRSDYDAVAFAAARDSVMAKVARLAMPVSDDDLARIQRIHATFARAGMDLRYTSHGRAPRPGYPTYRQLLLESDRAGRKASYLVTEDAYAFLRELQLRNLVVPVTGDFAGTHALREIAAYLRERGERVTTFYASNVEFYLMQDRTFDRFADNVAALPASPDGVIIRSLFGRIYEHPQAVAGYNSTQLLQRIGTFVDEARAGAYISYGDLVYRGYVDLR